MIKTVFFILILTGTLGFTGVSVQGQKEYPEFSWDQVPRYMHLRKAEAFTREELKYLAKFPIITLEKTTGMQSFGSTCLLYTSPSPRDRG